MAEPRFSGADQPTVSCWSPRSARGAAGFSGRTSGRATAEGTDGSESPTSLVATTWKVYSVSLVSPVIVQDVEAHCCDTVPPVAAVTVYPVIGAPLSAPASKFSSTNPSPISPMRGAEGGAGLP